MQHTQQLTSWHIYAERWKAVAHVYSAKFLFLISCATTLHNLAAQMPPASTSYEKRPFIPHAVIEQNPDNSMSITASSPRPTQQAVAAIRRQYGWVLDYEEGEFPETQLDYTTRSKPIPIGGTFRIRIAQPNSTNPSEEEQFVQTLIKSGASVTGALAEIIKGADNRLTVTIRYNNSELPILSTRIVLPKDTRTIEETIQQILSLVAAKRNIAPIDRGGMIDNELINTKVTMGSDTPMAARDLLAQALDGCRVAKVWLLGFEPSENHYVIAIESAVKVSTDSTGRSMAMPIFQRH